MSDETQDTAALVADARAIVAGRSSIRARLEHLEAVVIHLDEADAECGALRAEMDGRDDDLRELREESARMTQYIARIEDTNTRLHVQLETEQRQRERLTAEIGHTLGEHAAPFNRALALHGFGTPRDDRPHSLSIHEPRIAAVEA